MLLERQKSILEIVIEEHIRTAKPVASQDIARKKGLSVGPATIRNEMLRLDELGYLEQPYTSAGRVPTDFGYRFFVDQLVAEEDLSLNERERALLESIFNDDGTDEYVVKELARAVAGMTGVFAAAGSLNDEESFYGTGLGEMLSAPELQDSATLQSFGRLIDLLEEDLRELWDRAGLGGGKIFIGEENPLPDARSHAMIVSAWKHPSGSSGFLALVGPRRMNYRKSISLARFLEELQAE